MTNKELLKELQRLKRKRFIRALLIVESPRRRFSRYRVVQLAAPSESTYGFYLSLNSGGEEPSLSCFLEDKPPRTLGAYVKLMSAYDRGVRKVVAVVPL